MSFKQRLPSVLPLFDDSSRLKVIADALGDEFDGLEADTEAVQDSLFINTADGQSLDLIGDDFGALGQRRGRDDEAFRQFLRSVVPAFDGRGTERDVEVAVAAGVAVDPDEIDLRQDFANREYEVELFDWTAHRTSTVHELADLSDPVAVDRVDPLYYFSDEVSVAADPKTTAIGDIKTVADTTSLALVADETTAGSGPIGLSSAALEPLSTDGFVLSFPDRPGARITLDPSDAVLATDTVAPTATPSPGVKSTNVATLPGLSSPQFGGLSTTQVPPLST